MRPAVPADQPDIIEVILARASWMRSRGLEGWDGWQRRAESLASQAADPDVPVWVLTDQERITGVTSLFTETPVWGWTEAEQAEAAIFLATTVTDPAFVGQRLGCLMAWWSLDYAARHGFDWVRRGCGFEGLVRYYRDVQGWSLAHVVERKGVTAYLLARRAEPQPALAEIIADSS